MADDSEVVRRRLASLLEDIPGVHVVGEASNTDAALHSIERLRPDVVIVDLHMPGNGLHLVELLGQRIDKPMIVVLTNYPYAQYRNRCLSAGAQYFFDKATEFDNVVSVLADMARDRGDWTH